MYSITLDLLVSTAPWLRSYGHAQPANRELVPLHASQPPLPLPDAHKYTRALSEWAKGTLAGTYKATDGLACLHANHSVARRPVA